MKTVREYDETAKRDVQVDIDALLAAINEISESEVQRIDDDEGSASASTGVSIIHGGSWQRPLSWMCMTSALRKRTAKEIPRPVNDRGNLLTQEALTKFAHQGNLM